MWSFVKKKANKQWIRGAMDATTRQIIALHVGDRSRESAKALWAKSPLVFFFFYISGSYQESGIKPSRSTRGKPITSNASTIRCGNVLPDWYARTPLFSKKLTNHIGAIKYFICYYNLTRATTSALPV